VEELNRNWIELMNYLYLVFRLGCTAKISRAPHMFRLEDTLSPTSPATHFSALLCCLMFGRHINQSETLFCTYICEFWGVGERPNLAHRLFENREDPGDEVRERPIFGLPHGICPRFSKCILLLLKLRYFYFGAQNGNKSSRGIICLKKKTWSSIKRWEAVSRWTRTGLL